MISILDNSFGQVYHEHVYIDGKNIKISDIKYVLIYRDRRIILGIIQLFFSLFLGLICMALIRSELFMRGNLVIPMIIGLILFTLSLAGAYSGVSTIKGKNYFYMVGNDREQLKIKLKKSQLSDCQEFVEQLSEKLPTS